MKFYHAGGFTNPQFDCALSVLLNRFRIVIRHSFTWYHKKIGCLFETAYFVFFMLDVIPITSPDSPITLLTFLRKPNQLHHLLHGDRNLKLLSLR